MDAHLRDLRYFVTVADELSFTRASERLYVSQPALSKQIRGLEATLGVQLFDRDRRQVRLTAAGTALLAVARQLLDDWNEGVATVLDAADEDNKVLRVGTLTSLGRALYPGVVDHFAKHQLGWRIELRSFAWSDPTAGLADRTTDAAFVWLPFEATEIEFEVITSERRFVAVSSKHGLAKRSEVDVTELADESFAALPPSAGPMRDFWLGMDRPGAPTPKVAAEVSSADETFEVVSSGRAIVLLAEGNAIVYSRPGIRCIPVRGLEPAKLAVAWRRTDRRPSVAAFVRACRDALADVSHDAVPQTLAPKAS